MIRGKDRLIVALDVPNVDEAIALVYSLEGEVGGFKIGKELNEVMIRSIVEPKTGKVAIQNALKMRELYQLTSGRHFADKKFHDIPNTVTGAIRAAVGTKINMINVHCSGGFAMMKAAKDAALAESQELGTETPIVIGVTVLTSIDEPTLNGDLRVPGPVAEQVVHLAIMAQKAGLDGVVCSPHEIEVVRNACGPDFLIVTPGVRPAGADAGDQKRVMTPEEAVAKGADYLVIGRPITAAADPVAAARAISAKIDKSQAAAIRSSNSGSGCGND